MKCFLCRAEIPPGAPVYQCKVPVQFNCIWMRLVCAYCIRKKDEEYRERYASCAWASSTHESSQFRPPQPCAHCNRPVFRYLRYKRKLTVFCSGECQRASVYARTRLQRVKAPRPCARCRKLFTPKRTDSKYCSVACKQSAYRSRSSRRAF